ncbi:hypothetical protein HJC23_012904 [Cyclotella cryptica]|uniref:Glycosyl transferase CAP10 domain-containing protein n=1 Tax=Cyclotella cryptica TaxID=29204 RepID=A0ABD3Q2L5_9STRA|eukprot:CCRYP_009493-RB/>CCRYP_009493-RB protein AED:0.22 eAED:0.22 QI:2121/1/1/1/0/0/2/178/562
MQKHRRHLSLSLTLLATAACTIYLLPARRVSRQSHVDDLHHSSSTRHLHALAQFNDPTTVEFKHPIHFSKSKAYDVKEPSTRKVKPYNIESVLRTIKAFRYQAFFFVYHSTKDEFIVIHNQAGCDFGCARIYRIASILAFALRHNFPQRFHGNEDFVLLLSTGDVPRLHAQCVAGHCLAEDFAPILQFGSMYDASILPSGIAMPMPVKPHLPCFDSWQQSIFRDKTGGRVCGYLLPERISSEQSDPKAVMMQHGLIFREDFSWAELIPQIVWRGTDFVFLHSMFHEMRAPDYNADVKPKIATLNDRDDVTRAAIRALWELGDEVLLPRWRGVLLTSEAELEAKELSTKQPNSNLLPWINIKFASSAISSKKIPASQNHNLLALQSVGITAIGEYISVQEQSKYKYHIDLGGGGGTTWTGTIEKLAMPGVLFHHVTPTTDYFYNRLIAWVHYIPVRADLSDLREKFDWAEAHPGEAQKIAAAGTEFAKWVGTVDGFATMYQEYLVDPLKQCLEAYIPLDKEIFGDKTVMDLIDERGDDSWHVVAICSGLHVESCRDLNGTKVT